MTTFTLWNSNLEWQEKESIICVGVYFQHSWNRSHNHTHIFVAFLETENENSHLIALHQLRNLLHVNQRYNLLAGRMGNTIIQFWIILVSEYQIKHLRRNQKVLNLQMLFITKLKALLIKSLSNPSISSRVPTVWKYDCSLA